MFDRFSAILVYLDYTIRSSLSTFYVFYRFSKSILSYKKRICIQLFFWNPFNFSIFNPLSHGKLSNRLVAGKKSSVWKRRDGCRDGLPYFAFVRCLFLYCVYYQIISQPSSFWLVGERWLVWFVAGVHSKIINSQGTSKNNKKCWNLQPAIRQLTIPAVSALFFIELSQSDLLHQHLWSG
jgi:hypothetical protein